MTILIVEDDIHISNLIETLLKDKYNIIKAYSGTEALILHNMNHIDLVLLDLMLPGLSGEQLLSTLITTSKVIVLSAKDSQCDKIANLLGGANDYITKPFDQDELLARIEVQLRSPSATTTIIRIGDISLDDSSRQVHINDSQLKLTKLEFDILSFLMRHKNQVFSKSHIFEHVWNIDSIGNEESVKVHISNLRNKILEYTDKTYIETIWGIGFRILDNS